MFIWHNLDLSNQKYSNFIAAETNIRHNLKYTKIFFAYFIILYCIRIYNLNKKFNVLGTGRLISLCDDNTLHLWEINEKSLVELKSHAFEGKTKKISSICVESSGKNFLLGTEGGNIYTVDCNAFTVHEDVIYQDLVMQKWVQEILVCIL